MMDKKTYLEELSRYFNSVREDGYEDEATDFADCIGVECTNCMFHEYATCATKYTLDIIESLEKWSKEHPPKKFKVSRLEYDIMRAAIDYSSEEEAFKDVDILYELLINGYFKGAKSSDKVIDFFKNCEVVEE